MRSATNNYFQIFTAKWSHFFRIFLLYPVYSNKIVGNRDIQFFKTIYAEYAQIS